LPAYGIYRSSIESFGKDIASVGVLYEFEVDDAKEERGALDGNDGAVEGRIDKLAI
jgi:hypothetical protein